jgi:hypothetical protein
LRANRDAFENIDDWLVWKDAVAQPLKTWGGYQLCRISISSSSTIHEGLSVIEASAGTGKTYSISHLVARMILEGTVLKYS